MLKKFFSKLSLVIFCSLPAFTYAAFTITPVKLKINKDEKIGSVSLRNENDLPSHFQLTVYKVSHEKGKEVLTETKDLAVTPGMFKIEPGKTQLIRVAIKNAMFNLVEDGYAVAVKELPHKTTLEGTMVRMTTEFRIPVSIVAEKESEE